MTRIEILADAIAAYNRSYDPDSEAWRLSNPGLLLAFGYKRLDLCDEKLRRIFKRHTDGWRALCLDLELKIKGQRRMKGDPILKNLLHTYKAGHDSALFEILDFLQRAGVQATPDMKVQFFLEE